MSGESSSEQYYASFAGYDLPLKLQENLNKEAAEALGTYYIARTDSSGRLQEVRKMHDGEIFFIHAYRYDSDGNLVEARIRNKDGAESTLTRNSEGKLVKE